MAKAAKNVPEAEQKDMVDRYLRGQSARHIGLALDRGEATVLKVLADNGVKKRRAKMKLGYALRSGITI